MCNSEPLQGEALGRSKRGGETAWVESALSPSRHVWPAKLMTLRRRSWTCFRPFVSIVQARPRHHSVSGIKGEALPAAAQTSRARCLRGRPSLEIAACQNHRRVAPPLLTDSTTHSTCLEAVSVPNDHAPPVICSPSTLLRRHRRLSNQPSVRVYSLVGHGLPGMQPAKHVRLAT